MSATTTCTIQGLDFSQLSIFNGAILYETSGYASPSVGDFKIQGYELGSALQGALGGMFAGAYTECVTEIENMDVTVFDVPQVAFNGILLFFVVFWGLIYYFKKNTLVK